MARRISWRDGPELRYAVLWSLDDRFESTDLHNLSPDEHEQSASKLIVQRFRPVSLAVVRDEHDELKVASVWHRPVASPAQIERCADRKANLATAPFAFGRSEALSPVLAETQDPRARCYHRSTHAASTKRSTVARAACETEPAAKQGWLLCLVKLKSESLSSEMRTKLVERIAEIHRTDDDPGVHGAAELLLNTWNERDRLADVRAKRRSPDAAKTTPAWFVHKEGHTMIVIHGPVEFLAGSPYSEAGRDKDEWPTVRADSQKLRNRE